MTRKEIKVLDALWSLVVKEKAKYKCEHCGRYDSRMEAAHVVGRRHRATRWGIWLKIPFPHWDIAGHCLCHLCHQQYDEHGPLEKEIVEKTIGTERKEILQREAVQKVTKGQVFEEIEKSLKKERATNDSPFSD